MKNKEYPLYNIPYLPDLRAAISYVADKYENRNAFRIPARGKGSDVYKSFREFYNEIEQLGSYLMHLGLSGDRVAVLGENCYNWIVSYFAVTNSGNTALPLDRELSPEEHLDMIEACSCRAVICSSSYSDYIDYFKENSKSADIFIVMNDLPKYIDEGKKLIDSGFDAFGHLSVDEDSLAAVVFTSGTTGKSKGVMLSHKNIASDAVSVCRNTCAFGRGILVLPLHHTFSITTNVLCELIYGDCIYAVTSLRTIQRDMQKDKTTLLIAVPALVETMHKKILESAESKGSLEKMKKAMKLSNFLLKFGIDLRKKLFKEVKDAFGGELEIIICGGAALSPKIESDFTSWGFNMICGYGITECAPVASVNRNEHQKPGSVGLPVGCNEIRITDADENGIGEIQIKGSNVFSGYFGAEEENKKSFTEDEWFKTGDLGYIDNDGFVFITGRIKNLIILTNGKNVSPEELETKLLDEIPYISEVVVFADCDSLMAEIYPNTEKYPDAAEKLREAVNEFNRNMPAYKKIKDTIIRTEPFPKTTTMKIKRRKPQ